MVSNRECFIVLLKKAASLISARAFSLFCGVRPLWNPSDVNVWFFHHVPGQYAHLAFVKSWVSGKSQSLKVNAAIMFYPPLSFFLVQPPFLGNFLGGVKVGERLLFSSLSLITILLLHH